MKDKTKSIFYLTVLASFFQIACSPEHKDTDINKQLFTKNEAHPKGCNVYNTGSQAEAENEVILSDLMNYKFSLYWLSEKSELNFWENKIRNDHFFFDTHNLTLHLLDTNQEISEVIKCRDSQSNAVRCTKRLKKVLSMTEDAKTSVTQRHLDLGYRKNMTFYCAREFSEITIDELNTLIRH